MFASDSHVRVHMIQVGSVCHMVNFDTFQTTFCNVSQWDHEYYYNGY